MKLILKDSVSSFLPSENIDKKKKGVQHRFHFIFDCR